MATRYGWLLVAATLAAIASQGRAQTKPGAGFDGLVAMERQDLGVPPSKQLHAGPLHGPTPASLPGGQVITTKGLAALVQGRQAPYVLFDVLGQAETLPGALAAAWLAQAGRFDDATQAQASQLFAQSTQGRKDVAMVFYCLSRECWMSYNAALRAVNAGYKNVLWYRGGIEAWKMAGLPTQQGGATMPPPAQAQGGGAPQRSAEGAAKFVPVKPLAREPSVGLNSARPAGELRIGQGKAFSFALPPGWRVGEDGQFALSLLSPDSSAMTVMVGNAGWPPNYSAGRFAYEKLSSMQLQNLQVGAPRPARPVAGFQQAYEFDVSYSSRGNAYRGVAKVSVAPAYDTQTMAMTAALAPANQWSGYASWLPQVADQVSASNGAAFGMRGVMQQNLQNSTAFAESARQYREWSQKNWQGVTDARNASQDRRNFAVRENLGGVQTFANPYGNPPVEMPLTHKYYWANRNGNYVGTDDPSVNPNDGSTGEWRKMQRVQQ